MLHKISDFCDRIDFVKKQSDKLRELKYNTPKSNIRDQEINYLISDIQSVCLTLANDKSEYGGENGW